ncbi:tyrosine-type recombinase/integrase [Jiangella anatolica]|uniref:tyrosine-type recombinase/integrase n=1 Tax=Jiangella anatolica TaxID=2670374 RepID=UPI001314022D|nr:tyrosine-type recombinase/integrase [Jiangella anatolica]
MTTNSTRLDEAIEQWLASRKAQGIRSGLANDRSTLLNFLTVVGNIYPKSITPRHIDMWLEANAEKWQASSRKVNIHRLSAFQEWCRDRNLMPRNVDVLKGRRKVKVPRKRRPRVPKEEFAEILDRARVPRDRIMLALGLFLMVRANEMVRIQWGHVGDHHILVDRSKTGDYTDELPIGPDLAEELARWRREVCVRMGVTAPGPRWYIVCQMLAPTERNDEGQWTRNTNWTLRPDEPLRRPLVRVKNLLRMVGIEEPGTGMHTLRRSGARALLEQLLAEGMGDGAVLVVQNMLGHEGPDMTLKYVGWETGRAMRDKVVLGRRIIPVDSGGDVIELRQRGSG